MGVPKGAPFRYMKIPYKREKNPAYRVTFYACLLFSTSCIFNARTFNGRPNKVINPLASWWSYKSPVVKDAKDSLYRLYGEVVPALMMLPL